MKFFISKKGIALLVTLAVVGASAFGAYAYFTAGGSGNGTASAGNHQTSGWNVTVVGDDTNQLYPGGAPALVHGSVANQDSGNQGLQTITVAITGDSNSGTGCDPSNFVLSGAGWTVASGGASASHTYTPAVDIGPGGSTNFGNSGDPTGPLNIAMSDTGVNQDACAQASIGLTATAG